MELFFARNDILQSGATSKGSLKLLPVGKKKQQKVVQGDCHGVLNCFTFKKGEIISVFKLLPTGQQIECIALGKGTGQGDKIFTASGQTVRGINKKGKEFFKFTTNLTETMKTIFVNELQIWATGEYTYSHFVDCKDKNFFMATDKVNAFEVLQVTGDHEWNPVLGCQDHFVRVLRNSELYYEASVDGPVRNLYNVGQRHEGEHSGRSEIIYSTEAGAMGQMFLDGEAVRRGWKLSPDSKTASVEVANQTVDITKDGVNDLIVGRDDGLLEIFTFDAETQPKPVYKRSLNESITALECGYVTDPGQLEMVVATYSGKIVAFAQAGPDGQLLTAPSGSKDSDCMTNDKKIRGLRREIEVLRERVEKEREKYTKVSEDLIAVNHSFRVNDKFVLDTTDGSYLLTIETPMPIFTVALQSDVPIELMELDSNVAILSLSPMDPDAGNFCLATYRCQESSNRIEIKLRVVEGHYGNLQAFVIPRISPKTCQICQYKVKPLCLQQRVQKIDDKVPTNELKIAGGFTLDEMHSWVGFCLPEIPSRPPGDEVTYHFESVLMGTVLMCKYKAGEGVFRSDSITTLAILKEGITKEATARKTRISISFDLKDESVAHFFRLLHPKLEYQLSLSRKMQLIEALKEVKMQEEDVSFLDPAYKDVLDTATAVEKQFKQQPRQLEYLHGIVKDLFIDYHKFKGTNVKHRVGQLDQVLREYDLEQLIAFVQSSG